MALETGDFVEETMRIVLMKSVAKSKRGNAHRSIVRDRVRMIVPATNFLLFDIRIRISDSIDFFQFLRPIVSLASYYSNINSSCLFSPLCVHIMH